jgi:GDP-4-dehydro-6-deoxy-D-mannose reductase
MLERGHVVFGGTIDRATGPAILTEAQRASVHWRQLDTGSSDDIARALDEAAPDYVVHLAALSFLQDAAETPTRAFDINALGALRVLHRLASAGAKGVRVLIVGSAEQYGPRPNNDDPIVESAAQAPTTIYGAAKASQELIALQLARSAGIPVVCTRSFNHSGFGQNPQFLLPSLVERSRALPIRGGVMRLGNAAPVRDYLHVADVAAAYEALLERGTPSEVYNVSSGRGISVGELAQHVLKRLGIAAEIATDQTLTRVLDIPVLVGNNSKIRSAVGWAPKFSVDDIIDDLIHAKTR